MHTPESVRAPVAHEGIALALRCAYLPRSADMPRDIAYLLAKLD